VLFLFIHISKGGLRMMEGEKAGDTFADNQF